MNKRPIALMHSKKGLPLIAAAFGAALFSCNPTKHLPEGEALYTGATINLQDSGMSKQEQKVVRTDLKGLTRPRPNSRVLGIPFKLNIYNLLRNKKEKSFFGKLRSKWGEPPVLLSNVNLQRNVEVLQSNLENKGYLRAQVSGDTTVKNKKATADYTATTGILYTIDSVFYESDTSSLTAAIKATADGTLLKQGEPFNLDLIKGERTRIDAILKEQGFYYFSGEQLLIKADTSEDGAKVDVQIVTKEETPAQARVPYSINDVVIYTNYSLDNNAATDTSTVGARQYLGYTIVDKENTYKPYLFEQVMQFDSGDLYKRSDHNLTLNRLINLDLFKFVKNRFEAVPGDSARLNAYYYLTPHTKKAIRAEINTNTKSNNLNGTQVAFSFNNRNTFGAGEQFNLRLYGGSEAQFSGTFKGYPVFRIGGEANFTMPRFVVPFFDPRTSGGFVPRTNIQVGYEMLNRKGLYTLHSFRGGYGYLWKNSIERQHEFYPITITYVQPINVTDEYRSALASNPALQHIIDTQFILGSTYQYNYNGLTAGVQKTNSYYFNGLADISGNVAGLFVKEEGADGKRILNTPFSQYIKFEADGRWYRRVGLKSTWANRLILGYGLPYGNSDQIPYIRQFWAGGNNSIRAFRSRSLGPGTFAPVTTTNFLPDQTGDIKIELNTEFRPHITGPLYGAAFVDAGNIWLKNPNPDKPGAEFTKDFLKQLAIGAGLGIRVDITLFVLRLDAAIPLRKPWEQNPWVMDQINFRNQEWRRQNVVFNLAIGYPF